jgi:periplasmic copper chaperone A
MTRLFRCARMFSILLITLAGAVVVSQAHEYTLGSLSVAHPWAAPTPPGAKTGAGYLKISNRGTTDLRLVGGFSHFSGGVEIHSMTMDGDIMRMRRLSDGVVIPAGGEVEFQPGGMHLMLTALKQPLVLNDRIPIVLHFEGGEKLSVVLFVERPKGASQHGGH